MDEIQKFRAKSKSLAVAVYESKAVYESASLNKVLRTPVLTKQQLKTSFPKIPPKPRFSKTCPKYCLSKQPLRELPELENS